MGLIQEYNTANDCDKAFTDEINNKIGCLDDDGNFLRYRDKINNVEIYIVYSFTEEKYMAFFRRDATFQPKETSFEAKTWEILMQHVRAEMRNSDFSSFLGILAKKKISRLIDERGQQIFADTP